MSDPREKAQEEILLAKRMFFAGCLGLPWLWICNSLYFRLRIFGPMVMVDYWPGKAPPPRVDEDAAAGAGGNDGADNQQSMERQLEVQMERAELEKWVKRSTRGAFVVMALFVTWIVVFQVNKEHFGPRWFVMGETDAEVTGW